MVIYNHIIKNLDGKEVNATQTDRQTRRPTDRQWKW